MIEFKSLCNEDPYILLKEKYDIALKAGQQNIEAIAIGNSLNYKEHSIN